jgi:hypothetical protein
MAPAAISDGGAVLDSSVVVTPPGEGIPAKYVAFSGIWGGQLDGMYDGKLAVLTITRGGNVTATYAWGDLADNRPGVADGEGKISGSTLKLRRLPIGGDVSATMQPGGTLAVTYGLADRTYTGTFTRQ